VDQEILPEELKGKPDLKPRAGDILTEQVMKWAEKNLKPPFFLYVHYVDPHAPYVPQPQYTRFEEDYDPITPERLERFHAFLDQRPELRETAERDMEEIRRLIDLYDGEVKYVDKCMGDFFGELDRLGFLEDTIIALTSDHGEGLWDHLHYQKVVNATVPSERRNLTTYFMNGHGFHLFEELIQVPLIIKGPGISGNRIVETTVENVDLLPTLLALTGGEAPPGRDGQNLYQILTDPNHVLAEKEFLYSYCNQVTCTIQPRSRLKLLRPNQTGSLFGLDTSLYDLSRDPGENRNFLSGEPNPLHKAADSLKASLQDRERKDPFLKFKGEYGEATRRKMKELGYLH
jgi:arylsulfatase A-like enzyme